MTEKIIQAHLYKAFHSHKYKFLNTFFFKEESDWLSFLNGSNYCWEIEVKISRSDFKADFKKKKHKKIKALLAGKNRVINYHYHNYKYLNNYDKIKYPDITDVIVRTNNMYCRKPDAITIKEQTETNISWSALLTEELPNRFYYAVPKGLITAKEVPDYAGLIYINPDYNDQPYYSNGVEFIKQAPFIHRNRIDPTRVFDKMYYKYEQFIIKQLNI